MAAKRLAAFDTQNHVDQPKGKRTRPTSSFASVIGEVMMVKSLESLCNCLEPLIRAVVKEEVERGIQKRIPRSPSFRIEKAVTSASMRLIFSNTSLPTIFTCSTILDIKGEPLQVMLVHKIGHQITPIHPQYPIKIELLPVDGDFPGTDTDTWTPAEFDRRIIKERQGRRPLLTKEVNYTMKNTNYVTVGEFEFSDNSSWLRSRRFKVGARVVEESSNGVRILEALTEAFIVKDHRGESYRKHYPPMLGDCVWRLEKIGKDGKFHKRLAHAGIRTVQDFLKLSVIDHRKLKKILGGVGGISKKMWETVLNHAKTCQIGNKQYVSRGSNYTLTMDAICQIIDINFAGQQTPHLTTSLKHEVDELVKNAYENWDSLQEVNDILQLPQGVTMGGCNTPDMRPYDIVFGGIIEVSSRPEVTNNNEQIYYADWEAEASPHIFG